MKLTELILELIQQYYFDFFVFLSGVFFNALLIRFPPIEDAHGEVVVKGQVHGFFPV